MIYFGEECATVKTTQKEICEQMLTDSEKCMMNILGQCLGMTGHFPDNLDPDGVKMISDALKYWNQSKQLILASAQMMDDRHKELCKELEEQRKFLDQQAALLREQSKALEEISRKLDKTSKTKAE